MASPLRDTTNTNHNNVNIFTCRITQVQISPATTAADICTFPSSPFNTRKRRRDDDLPGPPGKRRRMAITDIKIERKRQALVDLLLNSEYVSSSGYNTMVATPSSSVDDTRTPCVSTSLPKTDSPTSSPTPAEVPAAGHRKHRRKKSSHSDRNRRKAQKNALDRHNYVFSSGDNSAPVSVKRKRSVKDALLKYALINNWCMGRKRHEMYYVLKDKYLKQVY